MRVLLVEDEDPKREAILNFITKAFPEFKVELARSVRTAIASIRADRPDMLLLDMSLPTFDIALGEPGGRPQGFGGIEIMRFIEMQEIELPTIVITGYEAFSKANGQRIGVDALHKEFIRDFPNFFRGLIYFDPITGVWDEDFRQMVIAIIQEKQP